MDEEQTALFEQKCVEDQKCAESLKIIKTRNENEIAELETKCKSDSNNCNHYLRQYFAKQYQQTAHCRKIENCYDEINRDMENYELNRTSLQWCTTYPRQCNFIKNDIKNRQHTKKTWCDSYPDICLNAMSKAESYEKQRVKNREKMLEKITIKEKEKKQKEEEIRKNKIKQAYLNREKLEKEMLKTLNAKQQEFDKKFIEDKFECQGYPDTCYSQINKLAKNLLIQRRTKVCESSTEGCSILEQEIKDHEMKPWCEKNKKICELKKVELSTLLDSKLVEIPQSQDNPQGK